ncbi:hypothetical protein EA796_06665 [Pseudomonas sp. AOB-7]|uniref:hypothetical protein n=1 Tax=Pseudomonas sp. AOB-7 TaxID=2482750 RepID=UPI000EFD4479|nr:hypothetical protein [Pseudomonas sp. AOB-7]RMH85186.1 hypothetical protein EA796_06665 [Pseudomonas sp. AOB-7]
MNTAELIQQTESELQAAEGAVEAAQRAFEVAARTGSDCIKERAQQRQAGEEVERLTLRLEYLREQLSDEAEAERASQAADLREQVIGKYCDLLRDYSGIKAQADKLTAQLAKFNQAAEHVIQTDIRKLKALGGEALPREVAHTFIGHTYDARAFEEAWRTTQHLAASGLESGAYQVK